MKRVDNAVHGPHVSFAAAQQVRFAGEARVRLRAVPGAGAAPYRRLPRRPGQYSQLLCLWATYYADAHVFRQMHPSLVVSCVVALIPNSRT